MSNDIKGIDNITDSNYTNISKILNCCELKENEFENILKDFEKYEKKFNKKYFHKKKFKLVFFNLK